MDSYVIETAGVTRSFAKTVAVQDLNLRVPRGSVYGFLGRNGAGKTTAIKMLVGLIWPYAGTIKINGIEPEDRCRIGYASRASIFTKNPSSPSLAIRSC